MPRRRTTSLRAAPILTALHRRGVDFVTIGSYGAILQNIDLPMTDIDIVPKYTRENRRRLVSALDDLDARELVGDTEEDIDELRSDPDSMGDSIFRTFVTGFGAIDVVLRPAGFPNGYEDLIENAFMATVRDELEPGVTVKAIVADARDIYKSKQEAGRRKDVQALPAFHAIHVADAKERLRERYRDEHNRDDLPPAN